MPAHRRGGRRRGKKEEGEEEEEEENKKQEEEKRRGRRGNTDRRVSQERRRDYPRGNQRTPMWRCAYVLYGAMGVCTSLGKEERKTVRERPSDHISAHDNAFFQYHEKVRVESQKNRT